jgi:type I restriction enzyme S subunit
MIDSTLPTGWRLVPLVEVAEIIQGQSPPGSTYNAEGVGLPFFQGKKEFGDMYPQATKWCSEPRKVAEPGDVLLSIRAPVGPTNLTQDRAAIGRGLAALRPVGGLASKYLLYAIRATEGRLRSEATGTTFEAVGGKSLRAHLLPLAPPDLRSRLVAEIETQLTRLDAAVAALQRARANLKRYRASLLQAAVTREIVGELGSNGDRPDWTQSSVGELAEEIRYGTSVRAGDDASGIPVLRMGNLEDGRLRLDKLKYLPKDHSEFPQLLLRPGDVLFNRTNSRELVGKAAVYTGDPDPCSFASYLIRVRLSEGYEPALLAYFLNSPAGRRWAASVVSQQVGQANISGSKLKALRVPLPPRGEQEQIVQRTERSLSLLNEAEGQVEMNLRRATRMRQGILEAAFAGRLGRGEAF